MTFRKRLFDARTPGSTVVSRIDDNPSTTRPYMPVKKVRYIATASPIQRKRRPGPPWARADAPVQLQIRPGLRRQIDLFERLCLADTLTLVPSSELVAMRPSPTSRNVRLVWMSPQSLSRLRLHNVTFEHVSNVSADTFDMVHRTLRQSSPSLLGKHWVQLPALAGILCSILTLVECNKK
jgi:hypothetical protein